MSNSSESKPESTKSGERYELSCNGLPPTAVTMGRPVSPPPPESSKENSNGK